MRHVFFEGPSVVHQHTLLLGLEDPLPSWATSGLSSLCWWQRLEHAFDVTGQAMNASPMALWSHQSSGKAASLICAQDRLLWIACICQLLESCHLNMQRLWQVVNSDCSDVSCQLPVVQAADAAETCYRKHLGRHPAPLWISLECAVLHRSRAGPVRRCYFYAGHPSPPMMRNLCFLLLHVSRMCGCLGASVVG